MLAVKPVFSWRGMHLTSWWIMGMRSLSVGFERQRHSLRGRERGNEKRQRIGLNQIKQQTVRHRCCGELGNSSLMISVPVWSQTILSLKGMAIGFLYCAGIHVAPRTNLNGFGDLLTFTLMSASAFFSLIHIYLFEHCRLHLNVLILVLCTFLLISCICRAFSLLHPVAVHFLGYEA